MAHETDELLTTVDVEVDTSDLDNIVNLCQPIGNAEIDAILMEMVNIAESYKKGIEEGCKQGAVELAERTKSLQELYIGLNGSIATGALVQSIDIVQSSEGYYLIGTDIIHFYPLCVEKGRRDVYPIRAKALHYFTLSGVEIFSKHSGPAPAKPFVQPAFEAVKGEAEETVWRNIANATY